MLRWRVYCLDFLRLGLGHPFLQSRDDWVWALLPLADRIIHLSGRVDMVSVGPQFEKSTLYRPLGRSYPTVYEMK